MKYIILMIPNFMKKYIIILLIIIIKDKKIIYLMMKRKMSFEKLCFKNKKEN